MKNLKGVRFTQQEAGKREGVWPPCRPNGGIIPLDGIATIPLSIYFTNLHFLLHTLSSSPLSSLPACIHARRPPGHGGMRRLHHLSRTCWRETCHLEARKFCREDMSPIRSLMPFDKSLYVVSCVMLRHVDVISAITP